MKKHLLISVLVFILAGGGHNMPVRADEAADSVRYAVSLLTGSYGRIDTLQAVQLLQQWAARNNTQAMNALGVLYLKGAGVERDVETGLYWLETAGNNGYPLAFVNIGTAYHYGQYGLEQNFETAYNYYLTAHRAGYPFACYTVGYMLYKGLGCRQDYAGAADYFRKGAEIGYDPCMYMLGLCYRNGYGVERDEEYAQLWLGAAADMNYSYAVQELLTDRPEYVIENKTEAEGYDGEIPEKYTRITPLEKGGAIDGRYAGTLVVYDWSGEHILSKKSLELDLSTVGGLSGLWVEGGDTVLLSGVYADGVMTFDNTTQKRRDHYTPRGMWNAFDTARVAFTGDMLMGNISMHSLKEKEPERPICFYTRRVDGDGLAGESRIYTYPNPFVDRLSAHFELGGVCEVYMGIYTVTGVNVYFSRLGEMQPGAHTVEVAPSLPDGTYLLKLFAGDATFETVIVRKGGGV